MNTKRRSSCLAGLVACSLALASALQAQFNYPDFTRRENLNILSDARAVGGLIRLTSASEFRNGTVVYALEQLLQDGFETTFTFRITGMDPGFAGGDGLAFIIQNEGPTAHGPQVGYIPYN